jgi:NTE family protein
LPIAIGLASEFHSGVKPPEKARVGLVLGGGGVLGAAWLMGALSAVERETGWRARDADLVMGTSAGAAVAAVAAARDRAWGQLEEDSAAGAEFLSLLGAAAYDVERPGRWMRWGSWRMVVETWRGGGDAALGRTWAGVLPHGLVSTRRLESTIDFHVPAWPIDPELWIVATDYESGRREVFGSTDSIGVGRAVAASCAIPGFYRPVRIGSRLYVDGGVASSTNLDLLAGRGLDLVICLVPLSPLRAVAHRTPSARFRELLQRRLRRQIAAVEATGTEVLLIEPEGAAVDLIGLNFMNRKRAHAVAQAAVRTVHHRLRSPAVRRALDRHGVSRDLSGRVR